MFVCGLDRSWTASPFMRHGFVIDSTQLLEQIQRDHKYAVIDIDARVAPIPAANIPKSEDSAQSSSCQQWPKNRILEELPAAHRIHHRANTILDEVLNDVRLGHSLNTEKSRVVVRDLTASIIRNPDALLCLTQLKNRDTYTSRHSVNVCIFALAFGLYIGIPREELYVLGIGALLHDVGKMRLPSAVLNKPGRLTEEEFSLVKTHPLLSRDILSGCGDITEKALGIALLHHERVDGSGYPYGYKGREIPLFARMVSIIDVYDAITSDRVYHAAASPLDALRNLYNWRYRSFDNRLVEKFIRCLGIYPLGTVVELSSGEVGIVIALNQEQRTKPLIKLLLDRNKDPYVVGTLIDLALQSCEQPLSIVKVVDAQVYVTHLGENWVEKAVFATETTSQESIMTHDDIHVLVSKAAP